MEYKRTPIFLDKNTIAVIHLFTRDDCIEDMWMYDYTPTSKDVEREAAKQIVAQFDDVWTPAFFIALRDEITARLKEHDDIYGTTFAKISRKRG